MSISERERQALTTIEGDLAATGPELTSMLAMFHPACRWRGHAATEEEQARPRPVS